MIIVVHVESGTDLLWRARCGALQGKPSGSVPGALEVLAHQMREKAIGMLPQILEEDDATHAGR